MADVIPVTSIPSTMDLQLPDGNTLTVADGATGADAAAAIGPGLARAALAIKVDGEVRDLVIGDAYRADDFVGQIAQS